MKAGKRIAPTGPKTLTGSREAKRQAAVLLEVLSGVRGPQEGSEALGVSLSRYYALETRALQGLVTALEPRPRGRQKTAESELESLRQDKQRLEQELGRSQALVRAAQRSLGLSASAAASRGKQGKLAGKDGKPGRRRRRSRVQRGAKAVAALRRGEASAPAAKPSSPEAVRREESGS